MSEINSLFEQAQLAEAAYADLWDVDLNQTITATQKVKDALIANKFSETQATKFLKDWRVIDQSQPLGFFSNGFSATLVERLDANQQPTGQYTLAIAGSISPIDFANDLLDLNSGGVAYFQVQSLVNYVLRLQAGSAGTTKQVELIVENGHPTLTSTTVAGLGPGISPSQLTVTGHSLGGFLAQVYQRIFDSEGVYTYNALGVVRPNAPIFDQLTNLLGLPAGSFSSGPGENLLVSGEPAQLIGTVQGKSQILTFSETESTIINPIDTIPAHKMGALTDSLAVYSLLTTLAPSTTLAQLKPIFEQSSNKAETSLEKLVEGLTELVFGTKPTIATDDREALYLAINNLLALDSSGQSTGIFKALAGKVEIVTPPTTATEARADLGAFLSLYYLTPFALKVEDAGALNLLYAVHQALADKWNDDRNLTPEQITNGEANFSDMWRVYLQ